MLIVQQSSTALVTRVTEMEWCESETGWKVLPADDWSRTIAYTELSMHRVNTYVLCVTTN